MANLLMVIGISFIVFLVGGGIGWFVWFKTRPKVMEWNARVFYLTSAIIPPERDKNGNIVTDITLKELRPYTKDILERVEKGKGIVIYRLKKLNKTTPQVSADCVEQWGETKEVTVLIDNENCTLLKKGYDTNGQVIFNPVPYDRINMMINEMTIRKDRLDKEKDILQAITPFVVIGIAMIALVGIVYLVITGLVDMSANIEEGQKYSADKQLEISQNYAYATGQQINKDLANGNGPPSIE